MIHDVDCLIGRGAFSSAVTQIWNQIVYLLSLDLHHHSTVSNTTLKPIISPFHEISTDLATARSPDFGEQSNYITLL